MYNRNPVTAPHRRWTRSGLPFGGVPGPARHYQLGTAPLTTFLSAPTRGWELQPRIGLSSRLMSRARHGMGQAGNPPELSAAPNRTATGPGSPVNGPDTSPWGPQDGYIRGRVRSRPAACAATSGPTMAELRPQRALQLHHWHSLGFESHCRRQLPLTPKPAHTHTAFRGHQY